MTLETQVISAVIYIGIGALSFFFGYAHALERIRKKGLHTKQGTYGFQPKV